MESGYFITGTDTGVGKTLVSCALLHAYAACGRTVVGMKPVAAGCENNRWLDVALLQAASTVSASYSLVNPYALIPPLAPHIAARQANIDIDLTVIKQACIELQKVSEIVIVEGVGGFLVPLSDQHDGADLAQILELPVILVVGLRLGCLNHAMLTAQAVRASGQSLVGWVANCIDPQMLEQEKNIRSLEQRLDCPLLGVFSFEESINTKQFSKLLDMTKLRSVQIA